MVQVIELFGTHVGDLDIILTAQLPVLPPGKPEQITIEPVLHTRAMESSKALQKACSRGECSV